MNVAKADVGTACCSSAQPARALCLQENPQRPAPAIYLTLSTLRPIMPHARVGTSSTPSHRRGGRSRRHRRRRRRKPRGRWPARCRRLHTPACRRAHARAAGRRGRCAAHSAHRSGASHAGRLGAAVHQGAPDGSGGALAATAVRAGDAGRRPAERHRPCRACRAARRRRRVVPVLVYYNGERLAADRVRLRHAGDHDLSRPTTRPARPSRTARRHAVARAAERGVHDAGVA